MKKLIAILAMLAMGTGAMAADVNFTADVSTPGKAVVTWDANGILGIGLEATVIGVGVLDSVKVEGFNVFIDEVYSDLDPENPLTALPAAVNPVANTNAPGAITDLTGTFAICAGYLAENNPGVLADDGYIEFTASEETTIRLEENAKRGGVVNADGVMTTNLANSTFEFTILAPGVVCKGDVSGGAGVPDGAVSSSDLIAIIQHINDNGVGGVAPVVEGMEAADVSGGAGVPDGSISSSDVIAIIQHITANGVGGVAPCMN